MGKGGTYLYLRTMLTKQCWPTFIGFPSLITSPLFLCLLELVYNPQSSNSSLIFLWNIIEFTFSTIFFSVWFAGPNQWIENELMEKWIFGLICKIFRNHLVLSSFHLCPSVLHTRLRASEPGAVILQLRSRSVWDRDMNGPGTAPTTGGPPLSHPDFLGNEGEITGSSHLQPASWVVFLEVKCSQIPPAWVGLKS